MKKTIFEGVINGKKYDDVKEYNSAIVQAMKEGVPVEASTSTRTVDINEPEIRTEIKETAAPETENLDPKKLDMLIAASERKQANLQRRLDEIDVETNNLVDELEQLEKVVDDKENRIDSLIDEQSTLQDELEDVNQILKTLHGLFDEAVGKQNPKTPSSEPEPIQIHTITLDPKQLNSMHALQKFCKEIFD